uniref:NADH dehydrogenase [ubiquinone] 1 alpha subcomplex assembly factor 2 n=1 Tax=Tetraselmis sp. GSL018 TaxID=582737 RepID=A0A061S7C6_9CHLO|mmetsp:Transcript_37455/g.89033  ORF Transcript_37455/g.89033 Transcript_37455/m.89033 type:complete len:172 (-) Transcript_37455:61-576(-)
MNTTGAGRLRLLFDKFSNALRRRELVGTDSAGNRYFRWREKTGGGVEQEKRTCEYATEDFDPTSVPPIWKSWLQGVRSEPPTAQDIERETQREESLKEKVVALEHEEQQRRFRARSLKGADQEEHSSAAISALLGGSSAQRSHDDTQHASKPNSGASFQPDAWEPGKPQRP